MVWWRRTIVTLLRSYEVVTCDNYEGLTLIILLLCETSQHVNRTVSYNPHACMYVRVCVYMWKQYSVN